MKDTDATHSRHLPWMAALTALFVLRVLAQAVQWAGPVEFLPPFDAWQGSGLPYPVLFTSQVAIVALMVWVVLLVRSGGVQPARWKHSACFVFGSVYFGVMAFRLVAGLTFLSDVEWYSSSLPALFHIVLASYVLLFGHWLYGRARS